MSCMYVGLSVEGGTKGEVVTNLRGHVVVTGRLKHRATSPEVETLLTYKPKEVGTGLLSLNTIDNYCNL